jgi:hypothetical protein
MKCCWFFFFFACVVIFVQIRLRQQRDALKFPKKFAANYKVENKKLNVKESGKMMIKMERMLYGSPPMTIRNHTFHSNKGLEVECYLTVNGPPATFHTLSVKTDDETLKSTTVLTNPIGVATTFLNHKFFYLNPTFFITHTYDGHINHQDVGVSTSYGIVEVRNIPVVLDKPLGFDYVKL